MLQLTEPGQVLLFYVGWSGKGWKGQAPQRQRRAFQRGPASSERTSGENLWAGLRKEWNGGRNGNWEQGHRDVGPGSTTHTGSCCWQNSNMEVKVGWEVTAGFDPSSAPH